jgi:hypothetical protein
MIVTRSKSLYKQYTHLVTDDLKIDTETSYVHLLLQVSLQVSLHVSLHASLHTSLHTSLYTSLPTPYRVGTTGVAARDGRHSYKHEIKSM